MSLYGGSAQPPAFSPSTRGWDCTVLPCLNGQRPLLGNIHSSSQFAHSQLHPQKPLLAFRGEHELVSISSQCLYQTWEGFIDTDFPKNPSPGSRLLLRTLAPDQPVHRQQLVRARESSEMPSRDPGSARCPGRAASLAGLVQEHPRIPMQHLSHGNIGAGNLSLAILTSIHL